MRRVGIGALLVLAFCLSGCGGTAVSPLVERGPLVLGGETFSVGRRILDGFDEPHEAVEWAAGDTALFGILVHDRGRQTIRYARMEVRDLPPDSGAYVEYIFERSDGRTRHYTSSVRPISVLIFDEGGRLLDERSGEIAIDLAGGGFHDAAAAVSGLEEVELGSLPDETFDRVARGVLALVAIMNSINGNDDLARLMYRIVRRPSVYSVIRRFGVRATASPRFQAARPVVTRGLAVYRIPLSIEINGEPGLECYLHAAPVTTPRHVSAGVIRAEAHNPTDPDRWAVVELLAARHVGVGLGVGVAGEGEAVPKGRSLE